MNTDPPSVAVLAARLARAYQALNPHQCASLAVELCSIERAQRRHAERRCSGADGGYAKMAKNADGVPLAECLTCCGRPFACHVAGSSDTTYREHAKHRTRLMRQHDPDAQQRAGERIAVRVLDWRREVTAKATACGERGNALSSMPHVELEGDPRGPVLLLRLPGEPEAKAVFA
jgi:hypothetical protein